MADPRTYHEVEYDGDVFVCCDQCKFPQMTDGLSNHIDWCERDAKRAILRSHSVAGAAPDAQIAP